MLQILKKKLKEQRGLTLVELLAVVVILGIIAAIAIPSIGNIIAKSKFDASKADALQIIASATMADAAGVDLTTAVGFDALDEYLDITDDNIVTGWTVQKVGGEIQLTATFVHPPKTGSPPALAGETRAQINARSYD